MNDLLSLIHLSTVLKLDSGSTSGDTKSGVESYLIRLSQAHVVEALISFIEKMPIAQNALERPAVACVVKRNTKLKRLRKELYKMMQDPKFKRMREMRNNLTFHYDHSGATTSAGLDAYLADFEITEQPTIGRISFDDSEPNRFLFADEVMWSAWQKVYLGSSPSSNAASEMKSFIVAITKKFIEFAQAWLLAWIHDNDLSLQLNE